MDKLFIRRLVVSAAVGILPWERSHRQEVLVDLEIVIDANPPAFTDDISDALDYAAVRESIHQFAAVHRFNLIETFASRLSEQLIAQFTLMGLRLRVTKPTIFKDAEGVGVCIERGHI